MRNQKWFLIVGLLSLLAAVGGGAYAYRFYDAMVTTARVVTVARPVPPYTLLSAALLVEREVPRGILQERIYTSVEQLAGRMTTTTLLPGQLIYAHQAVPPAQFRYASDPNLEIVSFPIEPARAVGGQVQIGHLINVYRVSKTPADAGATKLLATGILVVDIRSRQGETAGSSSLPSQIEQSARPSEQIKPLQILTVAVRPDIARDLVELAASGQHEIWVSLTPLEDEHE